MGVFAKSVDGPNYAGSNPGGCLGLFACDVTALCTKFTSGARRPRDSHEEAVSRASLMSCCSSASSSLSVFKEWKQGESLTCAKNPNYWDTGKPYLDGFVASVVEAKSTLVELEAGPSSWRSPKRSRTSSA